MEFYRPPEVTNAFVHGEDVGHVFLTPGLLSGTADLTCEVVVRLVNVHAEKPGRVGGWVQKLPRIRE